MITHLGTPRLPKRSGTVSINKPAICEGACAYAYLGGLYRGRPAAAIASGFLPIRCNTHRSKSTRI